MEMAYVYKAQGRHPVLYTCVHIAQHVVQTPNPKLNEKSLKLLIFLSCACVCDASNVRMERQILKLWTYSVRTINNQMSWCTICTMIRWILCSIIHEPVTENAYYVNCVYYVRVWLSYSNEVLYLRHTLKKKEQHLNPTMPSTALAFLNSQFTFILWVFELSTDLVLMSELIAHWTTMHIGNSIFWILNAFEKWIIISVTIE